MGSSSSKQKILKLDDLITRKVVALRLASPKNSASQFLITIRTLNEQLIHFTQNYKSADYVLELKGSLLDPIFINIKKALNLLDEIILDLDVMLKDKRSKIDGKLDYIFEKFLTKKGTLGENKSKTFLGFLEELKKQASVLFKPILEELYKEPLLSRDIMDLDKRRSELPQLTNSLLVKVHETLKRIEGNIGVFVRSIEDIYSLWDAFFALGNSIDFAELCQEYKKLNNDAAELSKMVKNKLNKKTLDFFANEQKKQGIKTSESINFTDLSGKFGKKQAKYLTVLIKLHNFHVDFNRVKVELAKYDAQAAIPVSLSNFSSLLNMLNFLNKYFKLSDSLSHIIAYAKNTEEKIGGNDSAFIAEADEKNMQILQSSQLSQSLHSTFILWTVIILIFLIIVIVFLLWKNDKIIEKSNQVNANSINELS